MSISKPHIKKLPCCDLWICKGSTAICPLVSFGTGNNPAEAYADWAQFAFSLELKIIMRPGWPLPALPEVENPFIPAFIITAWRRLRG